MKEKKENVKSGETRPSGYDGKVEILDFLAGLDSHLDRGFEWVREWGNGEINPSAEVAPDVATPDTDATDLAEDVDLSTENGHNTDSEVEDQDEVKNDSPVGEVETTATEAEKGIEEPAKEPEETPVAADKTRETPGDDSKPGDEEMDVSLSATEAGESETLMKYREKLRDSLRAVEGFRKGLNPLPEDWESMTSVLMTGVSAIAGGEISIDFLRCILMGIRYDRDIAAARMEGELAGRNAVIEEKLVKTTEGDGLPVLTSGSGARNISNRPASIFDLADLAR